MQARPAAAKLSNLNHHFISQLIEQSARDWSLIIIGKINWLSKNNGGGMARQKKILENIPSGNNVRTAIANRNNRATGPKGQTNSAGFAQNQSSGVKVAHALGKSGDNAPGSQNGQGSLQHRCRISPVNQ